MPPLPQNSKWAIAPVNLNLVGFLAIACAATLWSVAAIVARELFESGVTPYELSCVRSIIAAIGLIIVGQWSAKKSKWLDWKLFFLGIALALVTVSYYVAIARLSVAIAIVIQYTAPALVVIFKSVVNRQIPNRSTVIAVITALIGVALISGVVSDGLHLDGWGLFAGIGSSFCFASYILLSESSVPTYGATGVMMRAFCVASLFWIAFQTTQGFPTTVFTWHSIPSLLFVGIGGTLVPFSLLCWGVQHVQAERGAIAAMLEPVIAAILAWVWLGQSLTVIQLLGGALVLGAVSSLQRQPMVGSQP